MEHEKAQTLLSDYIEGDLDKEMASELESHLDQCSECRTVLESLQKLMGVVRAMPPVRVPENFARRVRRRAYRAGLFGPASARSSRRMTAPFVGMWATWGLMLAIGLVLVIVFIAQHQIEILSERGQLIVSAQPAELEYLQGSARELGLKISPARGDQDALIILVPKDRWKDLYEQLKSHSVDKLIPSTAPEPDQKGIIHLLVLESSDG